MQENLLTIQKAANFLGVVAKTLRRWEKKGVLTPQRTSGNQRRYLLSELDKIKQEIEQKKNRLSHGEAVLKSIEPLDLASSFKLVISNISRAKKILLASLPIMILVLSAAVVVKGQLANANKLATSKLEYVADVRASNSAVLGAETQAPDYLFKVNVPSTFVETATFEKDVVVNGSATFLGPIKTQNGNLDLGSGKLSASNIIYGLTAGNGISVGNSQAPTISNTGVTSIQGKTGNVVLTAGSGLALDGLQINNTDVGSAQDIFKNITIGSTTITAGSNTDTLNLAAGSGVTLTSNSTTKTITISTGAQAAGVTSLQGQTGALTFTNGNGVSINGLQISNSGVLSLGGQAGALNLSSGSGISVSGLTVTNTDLGSSQNIFKNIGIGSSLITAGINNDTLQLASGSGIIISSNPFTNTATFGLAQDYSIQAAGWTKTGNYVNLSTLTDYVGIGTATPFATLDVLGNSGVLPVGNFYGNTSASVLAVNNDGVGDLFAASASGFPIFTINGNGNISDSLASSINFSGANLRVASCTGCVSLAATGDLLTAVGGSSTNIAPTGVASASTVNNAPQYAIDGSDATGWQAGDSSYPQ